MMPGPLAIKPVFYCTMGTDPLINFMSDGLHFTSLLGKGAMGAVYKATQTRLDRPVAVKVISKHLAEDNKYVERFRREAKALGRLHHQHVLACHDFTTIRGPQNERLLILILEFIDGSSLGDQLKETSLSCQSVITLHRQIAFGLQAAHNLGIYHRDIKPDNIMVTNTGIAKLADFGLAKEESSAGLTQTGALLGSPAYMAPEACRGEPPTAAADCYSLSCSLFHALTGRTPFQSSSALGVIQQHINDPVPNIKHFRPELAKVLNPFFQRALAKSQEKRYQSATDLAQAMDKLGDKLPPHIFTPVQQSIEVSSSLAMAETIGTEAPAVATEIDPSDQQAMLKKQKSSYPKKKLPWVLAAISVLFLIGIGIIISQGSTKLAIPELVMKREHANRHLKEDRTSTALITELSLDQVALDIELDDFESARKLVSLIDIPIGDTFTELHNRAEKLALTLAGTRVVADSAIEGKSWSPSDNVKLPLPRLIPHYKLRLSEKIDHFQVIRISNQTTTRSGQLRLLLHGGHEGGYVEIEALNQENKVLAVTDEGFFLSNIWESIVIDLAELPVGTTHIQLKGEQQQPFFLQQALFNKFGRPDPQQFTVLPSALQQVTNRRLHLLSQALRLKVKSQPTINLTIIYIGPDSIHTPQWLNQHIDPLKKNNSFIGTINGYAIAQPQDFSDIVQKALNDNNKDTFVVFALENDSYISMDTLRNEWNTVIKEYRKSPDKSPLPLLMLLPQYRGKAPGLGNNRKGLSFYLDLRSGVKFAETNLMYPSNDSARLYFIHRYMLTSIINYLNPSLMPQH